MLILTTTTLQHARTHTHTHTDTHTDTHRHTQTHTDTHSDTHTDTHRHTQTHTQTHTHPLHSAQAVPKPRPLRKAPPPPPPHHHHREGHVRSRSATVAATSMRGGVHRGAASHHPQQHSSTAAAETHAVQEGTLQHHRIGTSTWASHVVTSMEMRRHSMGDPRLQSRAARGSTLQQLPPPPSSPPPRPPPPVVASRQAAAQEKEDGEEEEEAEGYTADDSFKEGVSPYAVVPISLTDILEQQSQGDGVHGRKSAHAHTDFGDPLAHIAHPGHGQQSKEEEEEEEGEEGVLGSEQNTYGFVGLFAAQRDTGVARAMKPSETQMREQQMLGPEGGAKRRGTQGNDNDDNSESEEDRGRSVEQGGGTDDEGEEGAVTPPMPSTPPLPPSPPPAIAAARDQQDSSTISATDSAVEPLAPMRTPMRRATVGGHRSADIPKLAPRLSSRRMSTSKVAGTRARTASMAAPPVPPRPNLAGQQRSKGERES